MLCVPPQTSLPPPTTSLCPPLSSPWGWMEMLCGVRSCGRSGQTLGAILELHVFGRLSLSLAGVSPNVPVLLLSLEPRAWRGQPSPDGGQRPKRGRERSRGGRVLDRGRWDTAASRRCVGCPLSLHETLLRIRGGVGSAVEVADAPQPSPRSAAGGGAAGGQECWRRSQS